MEQKKIATSVDIMIKTAPYEYIHVTKYSEKNISYENKIEMTSKEDELSKELVSDVVRTLRGIPEQLGKGKVEIATAEEKIKTRIPEWLESDPEPNILNSPSSIANTAKKNNEKAESEIQSKSEKKSEIIAEEIAIVKDLFDEPENKVKSSEEKEIEQVIKTEGSSNVDFGEDLFADDADLFDEK
jgi:leucyl aminopeptidase